MKKKRVLLFLAVFFMSQVAVYSEEVGVELTADFVSKYIWRGQNLSDDPVFQGGISVTYKELTAGVWGNKDLTNINGDSGDFSELDYFIDYSADLPGVEGIGYSLGVIYYDFPGTVTADTTEFYGGLNFDLPLSPSVTVYRDIDEAEGAYVLFGVSHEVEKIAGLWCGMPVGMDIGLSLGWANGPYNGFYWGTRQGKLNDLVVSVGFPIAINSWSFRPNVSYITNVSDDIRATDTYGTDDDFAVFGISISTEF